ncbi:MAG: hypothetical protein RJA57_872 [Bacteroidota bacterium]|jgi:hypothetical protein
MKKFHNSTDLEREKLRLRVRQLEQEKALRQQWKEVKEGIRPENLIRDRLAAWAGSRDKDEGWLRGMVKLGSSYLGRLTGSTVEQVLEAGADRVAARFRRRKR